MIVCDPVLPQPVNTRFSIVVTVAGYGNLFNTCAAGKSFNADVFKHAVSHKVNDLNSSAMIKSVLFNRCYALGNQNSGNIFHVCENIITNGRNRFVIVKIGGGFGPPKSRNVYRPA